MAAQTEIFSLPGFRLDLGRGVLEREGQMVAVRPRSFALLCHLARNADRVVGKEELVASIWHRVAVTDDAIAQTIRDARRAIGDTTAEVLRTLPKRGYLLVAESSRLAARPPASLAPASRRPAIAVLRFHTAGCDPRQELVADGIADGILTDLTRIAWLTVVARNSSFAYGSEPRDVRRIGRELGAKFIVEGGVRAADSQLRVTVQVHDAGTGTHLWAERFDHGSGDLPAFQDGVARRVAAMVESSVQRSEVRDACRRSATDSPVDLYLRAVPFIASQMPGDARIAQHYLQAALAMDADYAPAHALLGWCHEWVFSRDGFDEAERLSAIGHARRAIVGMTDDAASLAIGGFVLSMLERDWSASAATIERALSLNPACATAHYVASAAHAFGGRRVAAVDHALRALELDLCHLLSYLADLSLGIAAMQREEVTQAAGHFVRSAQKNPDLSCLYFCGGAALALAGASDRAERMAKAGLRAEPGFRMRMFYELMAPSVAERLASGGRAAGLPE